jgi:copper resistance protein B
VTGRTGDFPEAVRFSAVRLIAGTGLMGILILSGPPRAQGQASSPDSSGEVSATIPGLAQPGMDNQTFAHILLDQFEDRENGSGNELRWDGEGWIGTDTNKLWLKSEGYVNNGAVSDGDQEALYDRPIPHLRYFDAQVGVRADLDSDPGRVWAAVGAEGLAPSFFEIAPTLYVRDGGHVAGRVTVSYDLLLTQRWIVQPEAELNFYSKDDPARRIGSGLSDLDARVRLRYEVSRKFAPYVGFAYDGKYGGTASYSRQAGETATDRRIVFGLRFWY